MTEESPGPLLYTEATLAVATGFSRGTLRNWRSEGKGPAFIKIGAAARYRPEDVDAWIAKHTPESNVTPITATTPTETPARPIGRNHHGHRTRTPQ